MKKIVFYFLCLCVSNYSIAADKDSTLYYSLPDSIKAIGLLVEINVQLINDRKEVFAGISTDMVRLSLEADKKEKEIVFEYPKTATVVASGIDVETDDKGEMEWDYNWSVNETYKLFIRVATDSVANQVLYSGYCWLPKENKWKLIGSCRITAQWRNIQQPAFFYTTGKKNPIQATAANIWYLRSNGSWEKLDGEQNPLPVINLAGHIDSTQQWQLDKQIIEKAIATGSTDVKENIEGVYYKIMQEGSGKPVAVTNTVSVFYKGYLLSDGSVFDQTKDKPVSFPLNRLIKGWQLAVPLIKEGGKIKIVIPSAYAYSIRTSSPKIPPNSVLVFEIEVVEVK